MLEYQRLIILIHGSLRCRNEQYAIDVITGRIKDKGEKS